MSEGQGEGTHTVASQLSGYLRGGGIIAPLATALIAFFIGGLVVAVTGSNPITVYKAIFDGSGLNWLLPWISAEDRTLAALNLQQTLILTTPLIFTGWPSPTPSGRACSTSAARASTSPGCSSACG